MSLRSEGRLAPAPRSGGRHSTRAGWQRKSAPAKRNFSASSRVDTRVRKAA